MTKIRLLLTVFFTALVLNFIGLNCCFSQTKAWQVNKDLLPENTSSNASGVAEYIQAGDTIYFSLTNQGGTIGYLLGKYDGKTMQPIIQHPNRNITKNYGDLYFNFSAFGTSKLARYRYASGRVDTLPNPDAGSYTGYTPFQFEGYSHYFYYAKDASNYLEVALVKISDTGLALIRVPPSYFFYGSPTKTYPSGDYVFFTANRNGGTDVKLFRFDGNILKALDTDQWRFNVNSNVVKLDSNYYTTTKLSNGDIRLVRFSDTTLHLISNMPDSSFINSDLYVFENKIWFGYSTYDINGNLRYSIANYDGHVLTTVAANCGKTLLNPVVSRDRFYFFNGLANSSYSNYLYWFKNAGQDSISSPVGQFYSYTSVFQDKLYQHILASGKDYFYFFDGNEFTIVPGPLNTYVEELRLLGTDTIGKSTVRLGSSANFPLWWYSFAILGDTTSQTLCKNGNVVLNSNVPGTNYQWQIFKNASWQNLAEDSLFVGTNNVSLTIHHRDSIIQSVFRCVVDNKPMQVFKLHYYDKFTGTNPYVSLPWENPANWSCGVVPDVNTEVLIPATADVTINSSTTIKRIRLAAGAKVSVKPGVVLTVLE